MAEEMVHGSVSADTERRGILNALKSTLFITLVGTPLNVLVCAGLAYLLSKPVPGKKFSINM